MPSPRALPPFLLASLLGLSLLAAGEAVPAPTVLLGVDTVCRSDHPDLSDPANAWRYLEVWQTDVCKSDAGALVRVDCFDYPHTKFKGGKGAPLEAAKSLDGSPLPSAEWRKPEFDDVAWVRREAPFVNQYRSLAMICLRGKFAVADPAKAGDLQLMLRYQGGMAVFLNGQEIGRQHLPAGALTVDSLAEEYAKDAYTNPKGELLDIWLGEWLMPYPKFDRFFGKDLEKVRRYALRQRELKIQVPATALRKGLNVLALEIHRAPANETMFTNPKQNSGSGDNNWYGPMAVWWNRCTLEEARLTASGPADNFTISTARPKGVQVWNQPTMHRIGQLSWGDANESLRPVELQGLRNGTYSGQVVLGSDQPIRGLTAVASDLAGEDGTKIPAANIELGFATWPTWGAKTEYSGSWMFDALEPVPPAEVPLALGSVPKAMQGAVLPVWITVRVPKTAAPGRYAGELSLTTADWLQPVVVRVSLEVLGSYVLPDPKDFHFYMGVLQSPDSLAMRYGVPLWSEQHWQLIDRAFALLAQIGTKEVHIPAIEHTQLGNEQSMVRWIKDADGSLKPDFAIAERYLDTALKHLHSVEAVVLAVSDCTFENKWPGVIRDPVTVTCWDAQAKTATEMTAPAWGTPEALAFWKPVVDGITARLAARHLGGKLLFGSSSNGGIVLKAVADLKTLAPTAGWVNVTHGPSFPEVTQTSHVITGVLWVHWDPEKDKPTYGWTRKGPPYGSLCSSRGKGSPDLTTGAELGMYRVLAEGCLLSLGWNGPQQGIGHVGGDFWPVLKGANGVDNVLSERWTNWSSLTMSQVILWLIGAGADGPVPTMRSRLLQESLQESELRIFVQDALLDPARKAKLGVDLAQRAERLCNDRTRRLRYFSLFFGANGRDLGRVMSHSQWQEDSAKLCRLADEVAKALEP